jgi:hypothetical protein
LVALNTTIVFFVIQVGTEVSICSQGCEQVPFITITNVTVPWPGRTFEDPDSLSFSEASTSNTLTADNLQPSTREGAKF